MTIQILRVIYAISILIGFIAGNVIVFNIEKKILFVTDKKYGESNLYMLYLISGIIFLLYFFVFNDYLLQLRMIMGDVIISLNLDIFFHVIMITLEHFIGIFLGMSWFIFIIPLYFWMCLSNQLKNINLK